MKHILLAFSLLTLWSCSKEPMNLSPESSESRRSGNNYGTVYVADLYAGQNMLIGTVELANYDDQVYVDDRTIDSHIKRLRKKMRSADEEFNAIETLYGIGYRYNEE